MVLTRFQMIDRIRMVIGLFALNLSILLCEISYFSARLRFPFFYFRFSFKFTATASDIVGLLIRRVLVWSRQSSVLLNLCLCKH